MPEDKIKLPTGTDKEILEVFIKLSSTLWQADLQKGTKDALAQIAAIAIVEAIKHK